MRSDTERLQDILEAIERIETRTTTGRPDFERDQLLQVWVLHHLQIIDEAARAVSAQFRQRHPEVGWPQIVGMRNILVHRYFEIDLPLVWSVVENDLPALKSRLTAILAARP